jgi:hypothetical protein
MTDKPARSAFSVFTWTVFGVAIIWGAIWNGLVTALPNASLDAAAGPVMGVIFGVVAGAFAYWRQKRQKPLRPVIIGIAVWFLVFGGFVVATAPGPQTP